MKQYEAVIETLERLGGVATLGDLNTEVFKIKDCEWKTKTPFEVSGVLCSRQRAFIKSSRDYTG